MVEAATVVFGRYVGTEVGRDGRKCLENWLKAYCLDYRLHNQNGIYSADMLFYKPVHRYWLTNRPAVYASRWGFDRSVYNRENTKPMSKDEYLEGPTPIVAKKTKDLLSKVYKRSIERAAYPPYSTLGAGVLVKVKVVTPEEWAKRPRVKT